MNKSLGLLWVTALACAAAPAQTTVTTSGGTTSILPVYTGTSTLGNSPVAVSGNNVGIGTTTPSTALQVTGTISAQSSAGDPAIVIYKGDAGTGNLYSGIADTGTSGTNRLSFFTNTSPQWSGGTENMVILNSGNIGIGTVGPSEKLEISGNIKLAGSSGAHIVFADGSQQSVAWTGVLSGGDYSESVNISGARESLEPGDLIVIDAGNNGRFVKSSSAYSRLVSGVYATKPGVIGRRQPRSKSQKDEVPMAMVGIVPTKVSTENGPIRRGDLLVSSSTAGYAMKGTDSSKLTGAVLGKALESLDAGQGVIEVLISLQ